MGEEDIMPKTLGEITEELTKKVLEPAKADAEILLRDAHAEAERIVAAARMEAEEIREQTKREIESLKKQMDIDLETACRNFIIMVEERLEKAVIDPVVEMNIKPLLDDREFLEKIIMEILEVFSHSSGKGQHIEVLLPAEKKSELESWFLEKFHHRIEQPLNVQFTDKISFGFKIGLLGKGSHINFSDGLIQVFSEFCSPRFRKYFFSDKELQ